MGHPDEAVPLAGVPEPPRTLVTGDPAVISCGRSAPSTPTPLQQRALDLLGVSPRVWL